MLKTRKGKPLERQSEKELRRVVSDARRVAERMPDSPQSTEVPGLLLQLESVSRASKAAIAELDRRKAASRDGQVERLRSAGRAGASFVSSAAFRVILGFGHPELLGETLNASLLTGGEHDELLELAKRRQNGGLSADETSRYEELAGTAAGNPDLFPEKRAEAAATAKRTSLLATEKRLPQAESLIAATLSDPWLLDALVDKVRPDLIELDEYGRETRGGTGRVLELEHVGALHLLLTLITMNGGNPIDVREHGIVGSGFPSLPQGVLGALRLNGFLTVTKEGAGFRVGVGDHIRQIAAKWDIALPGEGNAGGMG